MSKFRKWPSTSGNLISLPGQKGFDMRYGSKWFFSFQNLNFFWTVKVGVKNAVSLWSMKLCPFSPSSSFYLYCIKRTSCDMSQITFYAYGVILHNHTYFYASSSHRYDTDIITYLLWSMKGITSILRNILKCVIDQGDASRH